MEQITRVGARSEAVRVGVDLAKRVIQVHAVDAAGRVLASRALARDKFIAWCAQLPAGCVVALANKNARILWAVMTKGEAFDARHVSVKPGAATPAARTA